MEIWAHCFSLEDRLQLGNNQLLNNCEKSPVGKSLVARDGTLPKSNMRTLRRRRGPRISPVKEKKAKGEAATPFPIVN